MWVYFLYCREGSIQADLLIKFNQLITQVVSDGETGGGSFGDTLKSSMETIIASNVTSVGEKSVTGVKVAEVQEGRY